MNYVKRLKHKVDIKAYIESGAIESYVLGIADEQEAAELERLRARYPEIGQAIAAFEKLLEETALANAVDVPEQVKDQLLSRLHQEAHSPVVTMAQTRGRSSYRLKYIAAAAVLLFVASGLLNIYFYDRYQRAARENSSLLAERTAIFAQNDAYQTRMVEMQKDVKMMTDSAMTRVLLAGVKGRESNSAFIFWHRKTRDVYIAPSQLAAAPEGMQYQLWALVDGVPVDAGVIGDCATLCKLKNIPAAQAFAITLEKKGGSPTPTLDRMYVLGKVS